MIKSKAIELLKTFNPREFKEFGDFVNSPFFNKNLKLIQINEIFKKYYPDFNSPLFTKENVYAKIYPGKKYKDNEVRRNLSEILRLAEEYLSFLNINKKGQFIKKKSLLNELASRKLDKLFTTHINEVYEKYRIANEIDEDYFIRNFDIQVIKLDYDQGILPSKELEKITINNLLDCFKYLIGFSMITTLKLNQDFAVMHVNSNFDNKNTIAFRYLEKLNLRDFLEDIKEYDESLYYILKIYYSHFLVIGGFDDDDTNYWILKQLVNDHLNLFSRFEKYNLILF